MSKNSDKAVDQFELLPRRDLLAPRELLDAVISPDGKRIALVAHNDGRFCLRVADVAHPEDAAPVVPEQERPFSSLYWARNNQHILAFQDNRGDENCDLSIICADSGTTLVFSKSDSADTRLLALSDEYPDEILIESNDRDPAYFDPYRLNLHSGKASLLEENNRFTWIYADHHLKPRLAELRQPLGGLEYYASSGDGNWRLLFSVDAGDELTTRPFRIWETLFGFNSDASEIYAVDSRGRDTAALAAWKLESGESRIIASDDRTDIAGIVVDPASHEIIAYCRNYDRYKNIPLVEDVAGDFAALSADSQDEVFILSQALQSPVWLIGRSAPDLPLQYELYDRRDKQTGRIVEPGPRLQRAQLARSAAHTITARDGRPLLCYLTLPRKISGPGGARQRLPLVTIVHGGPWTRDTAAYDSWEQLLANRGYAVLKVNFRGSAGFGKNFLNAGNREWGGRICDDIIDAVRWTVSEGIADAERLSVMGASFGGYTTLMALCRYPQMFACGIDLFGPTDLRTFLDSIPAHWKAHHAMWDFRVGSSKTAEGRQQLDTQSPLYCVDNIVKPVLIAQGSNDPRVVQAESDQMASALKRRGVELTYVTYPDEGHGFENPANLEGFFGIVEDFLARHLGGRHEPVGNELSNSTARFMMGEDPAAGPDRQ